MVMTLGLLVVMLTAIVIGGQDHAAEVLVNFGPYVVAAWAIASAMLVADSAIHKND
jgi:hypothetical protein